MNGVQEITQTMVWQNILDSERNDGDPGRESFRHFPFNMVGIIRMLREDQDEHSASLKTLHDSFGPIGSRFDITGSDPTVDPSGLEMSTNRVRGRLIFTRMADEDHRRLVLRGIRVLVDLASYCLHKMILRLGQRRDGDRALLLAVNPSRRPTITLAYSNP